MKVFASMIVLCSVILVFAISISAQTTEFTYQGNLKTSAAPANGNFDLEFLLYDAVSGGTQLGTTLTRSSVAVAGGIFTVKLDFGSQFPGANRFIEIRVRTSGGGAYTTLAPRQQVSSSPYSIQSLSAETATNALALGGAAADQYVGIGDSRLSDARPPTAGSPNYVQNTSVQQAGNFNINGTGSANIFNAGTQYNIGESRILSTPGNGNLFIGSSAGFSNTTGSGNLFFGQNAGGNNSTGNNNNFIGYSAGGSNSSGGENTFVGNASGMMNSTSIDNAFFGASTGGSTTSGNGNAFFGRSAGFTNTTGTFNTALGSFANMSTNNLTFATAIGSGAAVSTSNTIVLGRSAGQDSVLVPGALSVTGPINGTVANATNAAQLGGIAASGFVQNTTSPQASSNFNITGNGTAGGTLSGQNINSSFEYRLGGQPFLNAVSSNSFFGAETGSANLGLANTYAGYRAGNAATSNASNNAFFGANAGRLNSFGNSNSFFGAQSGELNTFGGFNAFFGNNSGAANSIGSRNAFFGVTAGRDNQGGSDNTFVGGSAGQANQAGGDNSFFGSVAGTGNTTGSHNSFIGRGSGNQNVSGTFNTALGSGSNVGSGNLSFATAIGSGAIASTSNTIALGRNTGQDTVVVPGKLSVNGTIRVTNGAVYITNPNTVIITSPNGACWGITVDNAGGLSTFPVSPCP